MSESQYKVYPNRLGKPRTNENRGALRVGVVEENPDTEESGLAGYFAAVTHEEKGMIRFYVWSASPENVSLWFGPYRSLSEYILSE